MKKTTAFAWRVIILALQEVGSSEGFFTLGSAKCKRQLLCVWPASGSHRQKNKLAIDIFFSSFSTESMRFYELFKTRPSEEIFAKVSTNLQTASDRWPAGLCRTVLHCSLAEGGTPNGKNSLFYNSWYFGRINVPHMGSNQVTMVLQKFILWNWFSDLFS